MTPKSIRPFIGAKDFPISRRFYKDLGFEEIVTSSKMSYFRLGAFGIYLQDYYVKDWVENSMIFLEVDDVDVHHKKVVSLSLPDNYPGVRVSDVVHNDWGSEFFLHDPSDVLWHIGSFN